MGTTTIFTRLNDLGAKFEHLSKEDLNKQASCLLFQKKNNSIEDGKPLMSCITAMCMFWYFGKED